MQYFWQLLRDFSSWLPHRFIRFFRYLAQGIRDVFLGTPRLSHILWWWFGMLLLLLDILGVVEGYELLANSFKATSRRLTKEEVELAQTVFGNNLHYTRIRIDEKAWGGPKQYHFCYVSFHTINSWGKMRDDVFIHELVHVWQYQQFGAVYIAKALQAQWGAGYNYGGLAALKEAKVKGLTLLHFNFEQQADIVMDYYRLSIGQGARWGNASSADISCYQYFVEQLSLA